VPPKENVKLRIAYLIPEIKEPMPNFPFSYSFFIQCYYRLMKRDDHETLSNDDPLATTKVIFMFYSNYLREYLGELFLRDYEIDAFIKVPLTCENDSVIVP
jgi:hypothetical protein